MILDTKDKKIYDDGLVMLSTNQAIKAIHRGVDYNQLNVMDTTERDLFNYYSDEYCDDDTIANESSINHTERQNNWRYPSAYDELDLTSHFHALCSTDEERERIDYELQLFAERNLNRLLIWAIWFMDYVKTNDVFIGVGRGSSVSSYCLYLIGLHMINSIECGLDPREFLK